MHDTNLERQRRKWDSLAPNWDDTGPPASPSAEDVVNFDRLLADSISEGSDGTIMLLGCTPKLRDMLAKSPIYSHFDVLCVDFSLAMFERASQITQLRNPRERFVLADWLSMDLGRSTALAVLGDKVIDNVMPDHWPAFIERVHYHLLPGGCFVVHLALADEKFKGITFHDSLMKWGSLLAQHHIPLQEAAAGLWEDILTASAFAGGSYYNTVSIGRFANDVQSVIESLESLPAMSRVVFEEFLRVFWPSHADEWSSYQYQEIIDLMGSHFTHGLTLFSSDYDVASVQPIVQMKAIADAAGPKIMEQSGSTDIDFVS